MQLNKGVFKLISVGHLMMQNFKTPLFVFEIVFFATSSAQIFAQDIQLKTPQKDTVKQVPSTNERVVRVFLIEDRNPIKQVLNFDFGHLKKEKDSLHLVSFTSSTDTDSIKTLDHLQEVFQIVFSNSSEFVIKIDSTILNKQTKVLINDAIKNPLRWKTMDKNAIGGGIFIKKDPE